MADERVWVVRQPSDELTSLLQAGGGAFRLFRVLPLIAVSGDYPQRENPPPGVCLAAPHHAEELQIAAAMDIFLSDLGTYTRTTGANGNVWLTEPQYSYWDKETRLITTGSGQVAIMPTAGSGPIIMSLQRWPGAKALPLSPLYEAAKVASEVLPVIVAAGNWRTLHDGDTMSPFARLPGVISVGATADEGGTALTPTSSIGGDGNPGPDLVAWGQNVFVPDEIETSFAAPRVAGYAMLVASWLRQVGAVFRALRTERLEGAPIIATAVIDSGFLGYDGTPDPLLSMLPYGLGVDLEACEQTRAVLLADGIDPEVVASAHMVREVLFRSVRSGPGAAHEVGRGFIDLAQTISTLQSLTWNDLIALGRNDLRPVSALSDVPLAAADELDLLFRVAVGSRISYGINYQTGVVNAPVRPSG